MLKVQHYVSFYTAKVNADHDLLVAKQKIINLEAALVAANALLHP